VRPTGDKVRGAIFNILAARDRIEGRRLLDLFAGTGALGLDALSRGAASVVFVDESRESCRVAGLNIDRSGFSAQASVRRLQLPQGLRRLAGEGLEFEGALVDPPYRLGLSQATLTVLGEGALLAPTAWVMVEHAADEVLADDYAGLRRADARRYGSTAISLYFRGQRSEAGES
jgi:16S rRNA (guanine(966)-N(2))-methyltransferase RsmD